MTNNISLPPLQKNIHLFLFIPEGEIQSWDHSIKQWVVFLQTLQIKSTIYPVLLSQEPDKTNLALVQAACDKWKTDDPDSGIWFVSPDSASLFSSLAPKDDSNPDSIVILSPLSSNFVRHTPLKNMLKKLEQTHFVGTKRVSDNYLFPLKIIHALSAFFRRVLLCIPISSISGPTSLGERIKNFLARFLFGLRYEDVLFPVKMIRLQVLAQAWPQSRGNFLFTELAARANFLGFLFAEEEPWHETTQKLKKIAAFTQPDKFWWSDLITLLKTPRFLKTPDRKVPESNSFQAESS